MMSIASKPFRFSYLYAKCRTMKSKTNDKSFFNLLISSKNYGDIYTYLNQTNYSSFIKEPTYESINYGLKQYFDQLYKNLTKPLSKKEKELFTVFFFGKNELLDKKQKLINKDKSINDFKELDLEFIKSFQEVLDNLSSEDRSDLGRIFGSYFDNINLYTIFRLKILYNAPPHEILPFLFPYGLHFKLKDFNELVSMNSLSEFNKSLEPIYKDSFDDLSSFKQVLYKNHYYILNRAWQGFPFKISIIFSLLRMKEIEIKNIKSVIEGVKYTQTKDDIKRMLWGVDI